MSHKQCEERRKQAKPDFVFSQIMRSGMITLKGITVKEEKDFVFQNKNSLHSSGKLTFLHSFFSSLLSSFCKVLF